MLKRILVVEDNAEQREMLREVLSYLDFLVIALPDGKELFSLVESFKPDLLLIDYILPGENGVELCHKLKQDPRTSGMPVILMSAYLGVLEHFSCCSDVLCKPFDLDVLLQKINILTGEKSSFVRS
ncbi:response regulator [Pedobacter sp. P351]|uniref:response regulator n=1 Tax=Pedobacter superstes TaxID=3133441 RepID=UPI0030956F95